MSLTYLPISTNISELGAFLTEMLKLFTFTFADALQGQRDVEETEHFLYHDRAFPEGYVTGLHKEALAFLKRAHVDVEGEIESLRINTRIEYGILLIGIKTNEAVYAITVALGDVLEHAILKAVQAGNPDFTYTSLDNFFYEYPETEIILDLETGKGTDEKDDQAPIEVPVGGFKPFPPLPPFEEMVYRAEDKDLGTPAPGDSIVDIQIMQESSVPAAAGWRYNREVAVVVPTEEAEGVFIPDAVIKQFIAAGELPDDISVAGIPVGLLTRGTTPEMREKYNATVRAILATPAGMTATMRVAKPLESPTPGQQRLYEVLSTGMALDPFKHLSGGHNRSEMLQTPSVTEERPNHVFQREFMIAVFHLDDEGKITEHGFISDALVPEDIVPDYFLTLDKKKAGLFTFFEASHVYRQTMKNNPKVLMAPIKVLNLNSTI